MPHSTDEQLIASYRQGDAEAINILIRNNLSFVYSLCLRALGNQQDAQDATQEAFVKMWKHIAQFDPNKPLRPWLATIVRHTIYDILRRRQRKSAMVLIDDGQNATMMESFQSPLPSSAVEADHRLLFGRINEAAQTLRVRDRLLLNLYNLEGYTFREIAQSLHQSINTVKSRHRRALLTLKRLLAKTVP